MRISVCRSFIVVLAVITFAQTSQADAPPANTIPIIADRPTFEDIDTDFLCTLSWMHFDAVSRHAYGISDLLDILVKPASDVGLYVILSPWEIERKAGNHTQIQ